MIVIASKNPGKIKEFEKLFSHQVSSNKLLTLDQIPNLPDVIEDGETFEANAMKKAIEIGEFTNLPTISDDSGLVVEELEGRPGVYSARYAGTHGDDQANNAKVLAELRNLGVKNSDAFFISVIALYIPKNIFQKLPSNIKNIYEQQPDLFDTNRNFLVTSSGKLRGGITFDSRGKHGFGYDPIFEVAGTNQTLAQFPLEQKSEISHRAKAVNSLKQEYGDLLDALLLV